MIIEYTYSPSDLKKKCYGCKWLSISENEFIGTCTCPYNSIKNRQRELTQKACSWKNADQIKMNM
jgi:hypothetical protein